MSQLTKSLRNLITKPVRTLNHSGNLFVNPLLKRRMLFLPSKIDVEPTTKCNLNCIYCQVPGWERAKKKDLTIQEFKEILERFPLLKSVKLQGMGESFLNRDIFDMIKYCNQKDIVVHINTNGTVLDEEKIKKLFASPPTCISFSLNTPNRKTFLTLQGKDLFNKVIENIRLTVKEKRNTHASTTVRLWCVLNTYNLKEIPDLVRLAKKLNVEELSIQTRLGSYGKDELKNKNDEIRVNIFEKQTGEILKEAESLARELGINLTIYTSDYYSKDKPCSLIKSTVYISVEGEVVPCCVIGDPRIISMGSIAGEKSFLNIWNSKKYKQLRDAINKNELPSFCKTCYHLAEEMSQEYLKEQEEYT